MEDLKYRRVTILEKLKVNRAKHEEDYREAIEGYHEQIVAGLKESLALAESGKEYRVSLPLRKPENHLDAYDRVIMMFDTSHQEEVEMSEIEFNQYVCNKWSWSGDFEILKARYSKSR